MAATQMNPPIDAQTHPLQPGVYSRPDPPALEVLPPQKETVLPLVLLPTDAQVMEGPPPVARPSLVQFAALRDPRLRMVRPIPLEVSVEESTVVVCWSRTSEFGTGETLSAAIDDFSAGVRDLYWQLSAPNARLGADLSSIKQALDEHIQPQPRK